MKVIMHVRAQCNGLYVSDPLVLRDAPASVPAPACRLSTGPCSWFCRFSSDVTLQQEKINQRASDESVAPTSFLWSAYYPRCYYFEVQSPPHVGGAPLSAGPTVSSVIDAVDDLRQQSAVISRSSAGSH